MVGRHKGGPVVEVHDGWYRDRACIIPCLDQCFQSKGSFWACEQAFRWDIIAPVSMGASHADSARVKSSAFIGTGYRL